MNTSTAILSSLWSFVSAAALFVAPAMLDDDAAKVAIPPDADGAPKALLDSPRHGEWVDIALPNTETKLHTWVVYPERSDHAPVVVVIHEIFGMTDWVRAVADQLAAEGFIAIAPDLLSGKGPNGGGTDSLGEEVREAIMKLSPEETGQRLNAARSYALAQPSATAKSACIGFCWGGTTSFQYATQQTGLDAAVVYYGTAPSEDAALEKIVCPVMAFYGGDDARVTSTVDSTKQRMKNMAKGYTPHIFTGAGHGFLRQQDGRDGANMKAAQTAWKETIAFLKHRLE